MARTTWLDRTIEAARTTPKAQPWQRSKPEADIPAEPSAARA